MIDRRNTYRAVQIKPEPYHRGEDMFRLEYREWFWPFWQRAFVSGNIEKMEREAEFHAAPFRRRLVTLGKFPRTSQDKGEPAND